MKRQRNSREEHSHQKRESTPSLINLDSIIHQEVLQRDQMAVQQKNNIDQKDRFGW